MNGKMKNKTIVKKKSYLIVFLLIVMGVILPTFSEEPFGNFFDRLYAILTNPYFNMFFFFASGISVVYMKNEFSKSYNFVGRVGTYKKMIFNFSKDIVVQTMFLYLVGVILSIAGAAVFCSGQYGFVNHAKYDFNLLYYLVFFCVRSVIIAGLINVIVYLVSNYLKNKVTTIIILIINIIFLMMIPSKEVVHFYNMKILYHHYFINTPYSSFWVEFLSTSLEVLLLLVISSIVYKIVTSKKRDLL